MKIHFFASTFALASLFGTSARAHEPGEPEAPERTAPILIEKETPAYPEAARAAGVGGTVSLEITVGADGSVGEVKVSHGAGFGFDDAAVAAARRFRFRPATEHGRPIASVVLFDQRFVVRPHLSAEATAEPPPTSAVPAPQASPEGPSRYETTVEGRGPSSAASSTTVRNLDFDLRPKSSPNDLLRVVPGLLAVQHQGGGKADQLFLRGFDADHGTDVAVLVDGVPVNLPSHAHGQGYADLHWLIPEAIDRIDVVKGPYDVRYGDFATAGAVNLVTRRDFDESQVALTLGSFPSQAGRILATERVVAIASARLGGWAEKLHPWVAFEGAHDDGPFDHAESLRRYNLLAKLSYDLGPGTGIGALFSAYGSQWIGSGQIPEREVAAGRLGPFGSLDPSEGGLTERQMATLFLRHRSGEGELDATLYFTRYQLALWNDFTYYLGDPVNGSEIEQDDARLLGGLRFDYHFHRHWRSLSLRTTMGAEARYDGAHVDRWDAESCGVNGSPAVGCPGGDFRKRLGRQMAASPFAAGGNDSDIGQLSVSGFVEEDLRVNRYFRAIAGLRADYFGFNVSDGGEALGAGQPKTSGTAQKALLSPKASLVVTPVAGRLELYLNFGMGFHSNPAQVALADGRTLSDASGGSFTVRAVPRIYGGEVGARLRLWSRVDVAAAFWYSYLENETVFDADAGAFVPSDPTQRLGLDVELRVKILPWLYLDYDLAQATATALPDAGPSGALALAPKLYMTGGLTARWRGLRAGLRFRYLGARPAFDEQSPEYRYFTAKTLASGQPNPDYDPSRVTADGYAVVDAYVGYRWRFLEAQLGVQNLLNSSWREAQLGNHSCTRDETYDPQNPSYAGSGNQLPGGSFANRCGIAYASDPAAGGANTRSGVTDVHYTPGVPINLQLTIKAYF